MQQHCRAEQCWEGASPSKYSCPAESTRLDGSGCGGHNSKLQRASRVRGAGDGAPLKSLELRQQNRLGPMETVDDFITNESGNSLLLCVFSILLVFPGAACLLVIGGAFTLDQRLQERHQWVRPCAIVMLVLGFVLLVTAGAIFASICRSYRRARRRRLCAVPSTSAGGSPYTCVVQL